MSTQHPSPGTVHQHGPSPTRPWPVQVGFWLLLGIAAFYLLTEHRAHLMTGARWLPLLLLLACPLIHLFGHGGYGGHGGNGGTGKRIADSPADPPSVAADAGSASPSRPGLPQHQHGGGLP